MVSIYQSTLEAFIQEAAAVQNPMPVAYLQSHVETESDERRQSDGSWNVTPVNVVTVLVSSWNDLGQIVAWQSTIGRVYYRTECGDATALSGRFRQLVAEADHIADRIRQHLAVHFEIRTGVVSDNPVYSPLPEWVRDPC
jgi:hypothetical protein